MKVSETITAELIGFNISGEATIQLWSGEVGTLAMTEVFIKNTSLDLSKENLAQFINDGRYGCEIIREASVRVDAIYNTKKSPNYTPVPILQYEYSTEEIPLICKRGI